MQEVTDRISKFLLGRESAEVEFKSAKGGLPGNLLDTYSAFANTDGGTIMLGVKENRGKFSMDDLNDEAADKLQKDLWSLLNNKKTGVSVNLLRNDDVYVIDIEGHKMIVIEVPRAARHDRPVYRGSDPFNGTFKRNYEGDYKCTRQEVQRMIADGGQLAMDKRILDGYTEEDIDMESVRQYRQLFNSAKVGHVWSTYDDHKFLEQLGAYRRDRRTNKEGYTVAGILMFGKDRAITDDECAPNFFPDYRDETQVDGMQRWIDRICPDGTWTANLFQFYLRVLPRLQNHLPKPFTLRENMRVDASPAHIAIREVFINLLIHADYSAEGSLSIVYKSGKFLFSNPGTMLVSKQQFFGGGESVCRNSTIQKMFVLLGPADHAGSGGSKIMDGWRKNNWIAPDLKEKSRPDKVELTMQMTSLLQPQVKEELKRRFGNNLAGCSEQMLTVLAAALTEEEISNERLRYIVDAHKSDITVLLQQLCRMGLLNPHGYGRGTTYRLSPVTIDNSEANVDTSEQNVDTSEQNVDTSEPNVDTSLGELSNDLRKLLAKKHNTRVELESVIQDFCREWRSLQEIAVLLEKTPKYLKNHIIPRMIGRVIVREYPDVKNHPKQRYKSIQIGD